MKSNIEIVKDYLAGVRPVIQVGYTGQEYVKRAVGERWTDKTGQEWEQKASGPQKVNRVANIIREAIGVQKCKCGQEIKWGSRADRLFYRKTGLCEGCLIEYETRLRVLGIYGDYEQYKLASNELGATKDMETKILETIKYFESGDTDVKMLCNSEGFTERWKTTNADQILQDAKKDLEEARRRIDALTRIRDEQKAKYVDGATKYNLEVLCQTEKSLIKT
jgi:predicted transposase YbfD/YdcC